MKCSDCKIEMELINRQIDTSGKKGSSGIEEIHVYRCPRCYVEIEAGDEDYEVDE